MGRRWRGETIECNGMKRNAGSAYADVGVWAEPRTLDTWAVPTKMMRTWSQVQMLATSQPTPARRFMASICESSADKAAGTAFAMPVC
jgi:hypothetical protein